MKKKRLTQRILALIASFSLLMTQAPLVFAVEEDDKQSSILTPYEGETKLDNLDLEDNENQINNVTLYEPDDIVEIIVELKTDPLMDVPKYRAITLMPSLYTTRLEQEQQAVQDQMQNSFNFEEGYSYTVIMNGFSIKTEYKNLANIQAMDEVKNAFVAATYERIEPLMDSSSSMIGATDVWGTDGYTGKGVKVAVLDTGLDTDHEAFQTTPDSISLGQDDVSTIINSDTLKAEESTSGLTVSDVYINDKIPYVYDYADKDTVVDPNEGNEAAMDHGTHVAGTVAGYYADEEGIVQFSGIAPDAQLLIMKVFPDSGEGATDTDILAALEDAILLDVDVINMSLGSDAGFTSEESETLTDVYNRLENSGVSIMIAAGNSYNSAYQNNYGYNLSLAEDPDTSIISSPSTYSAATSVASINNANQRLPYLISDELQIVYTDTNISMQNLSDQDYEYVVIPGVGTIEDFESVTSLEGKIALIQRGQNTFIEKVANAYAYGAIGVIIYNNVDGSLMTMASDGNQIPAAFISKADGEALIAKDNKVIRASTDTIVVENSTGNQMSDFSSLGVTPDLKLKPEITAPGGSIYSTLPNELGGYGSMSGTSMATPHMAGASALVKEYLNTEYSTMSETDKQELINQLLMSTAEPVVDPYGEYYSPRKQGSGLAQISNAINTPAYLSVNADEDGNTRPKINLGDDSNRTGVYELSFKVTNLSDQDITYDIVGTAMTAELASDGYNLFTTDYDTEIPALFDGEESITVPANDTKEISITLRITDADTLEYLNTSENGTFVEGYVQLVPTTTSGNDITLSIPFMGFYGSWDEADVFDHAAWYETAQASNFSHELGSYYTENYAFYLGVNLYTEEQEEYNENQFVISPNDDTLYDSLDIVNIGLLRNAREVTYSVVNEDGEVVSSLVSEYNRKTHYYSSYGQQLPDSLFEGIYWDGTDDEGNVVPDGQYYYQIEAVIDYDGATSQTIQFPIKVDTEAPVLEEASLHIEEEQGRRYLVGKAIDNTYLANVSVSPYDYETGEVDWYNAIADESYLEEVSDVDFRYDITDYQGDYIVFGLADYGYNETYYIINLNDVTQLTLNYSSAIMYVGEELQLGVYANGSNTDMEFTYTSSNPEVASVDEFGMVRALSKGQTIIKVTSDTGLSVNAVIAVDDRVPTEIVMYQDDYQQVPVNSIITLEIDKILPVGIINPEVTYTSRNPEIAAVNSLGTVITSAIGTAIIEVRVGNLVKEVTIEVVEESDIQIKNDDLVSIGMDSSLYQYILQINEQLVVYAIDISNDISEEAYYGPFTWTSSDESIIQIREHVNTEAEASSDGKIYMDIIGVAAGTAYITVTDANGNSMTFPYVVQQVRATQLTIDQGDQYVNTNNQISLTATLDLEPSLEEDKVITWISYDESVATIDEQGNVIAKAAGVTIITANLQNGVTDYILVYVTDVLVTSISIDKTSAELLVGEEIQLNASIAPENATDTSVTWSSSDESIVTVDENGLVHAIAKGTAVIKATSSNGLSATSTITVNEKVEVPETPTTGNNASGNNGSSSGVITVATGDFTDIMPYLGLMLLAFVTLYISRNTLIKDDNKKEK